MQSVLDSNSPTAADVKRNLKNAEHELSELVEQQGQAPVTESLKQALYRTREAIAHLTAIENGSVNA